MGDAPNLASPKPPGGSDSVSASEDHSTSYGDALKSTTIIGGASVISVLVNVVRGKLSAVWLGPAGVGLMSTYVATLNTLNTLASGVTVSGVRQIADAGGSGDNLKVGETALVVRRMALLIGLVGSGLALLAAGLLSQWTFANQSHTQRLRWLSVTVLLGVLWAAQSAVLQGLRQISKLAAGTIVGGLVGAVISLPFLYWWRLDGIVPALILAALTQWLGCWFYARKLPSSAPRLSWRATLVGARELVALGGVMMLSGLMAAAVAYLTRLIVLRRLDLDAAGQYQAAFALSFVYTNFILQAMGADYYPRLVASSTQPQVVNRLVNEQTEISVLLALPGIIFTLALAPLIIYLCYSSAFQPAIEVLRWQILGVFGRVASWPLAFVQIAQGRKVLFLCTEAVSNVLHVCLIWLGCRFWGIVGAGVAFFVVYAFYWALMLVVVGKLTGFRYSSANLKLWGWSGLSVSLAFLLNFLLPRVWYGVLGLLMGTIAGALCLRTIAIRVPNTRIAAYIHRFLPNFLKN